MYQSPRSPFATWVSYRIPVSLLRHRLTNGSRIFFTIAKYRQCGASSHGALCKNTSPVTCHPLTRLRERSSLRATCHSTAATPNGTESSGTIDNPHKQAVTCNANPQATTLAPCRRKNRFQDPSYGVQRIKIILPRIPLWTAYRLPPITCFTLSWSQALCGIKVQTLICWRSRVFLLRPKRYGTASPSTSGGLTLEIFKKKLKKYLFDLHY